MKVLFVALGVYAPGGGMEQFNRRVVTCLAELAERDGLESQVVALWDTAQQSSAAPPSVAFAPARRNKIRAATTFLRHAWRARPDVILYGHILLSPLACAARLLSPRSRHLLFVHGRDVWREPFRNRIPLWERAMARAWIDRVVAVSRFTVSRMKTGYGLADEKFRLLPNAIDLPDPVAPPVRRGDNGDLRMLTVARLDSGARHKGCDKVIRALPAILAKFPNLHYEIVGRGPLGQELAALARQLGVESRVHIRGYLDDSELEETYRRSHLFVLPSVGEGFGIVFLEAWKHGLPVVAGNRDASAEVVTHSRNGFCVDPESPQQLVEAVCAVLEHPDRAAEMGRAGYETVLHHYTHPHFRDRLAAILKDR